MTNDNYAMNMTVTDIYEAMNSKAESFFEWAQSHPKYGLLFAAALLALWLAGLLLRWKWACHWQFNSSLGSLTIASLKYAARFKWCWSAWR